jgi:hypothetical protein
MTFMTRLNVYVDFDSFGSSADDITTAICSAVDIFNNDIIKGKCQIDGFDMIVSTDEETANIVICKKHRVKLNLKGNLSVELIPSVSETEGKNIYLDILEIAVVSASYDKPFAEIVCEAVCRELCHVLGVNERLGLHRFGSKEYQKDFGLMLSPYSPYNSKLGKEYYLTDDEVAALKATVSSMVEH